MKHIRRLLMILFSNRVVGLNIPMHDKDFSYHALGTVVTVAGYTTWKDGTIFSDALYVS